MPMATAEKVREIRVRRRLDRRGLKLMKARRRDPGARDFGRYAVAEPESGAFVFGFTAYISASLEDVERWIEDRDRAAGVEVRHA